MFQQRKEEADEFYAAVLPPGLSPDAQLVARQAFAGMLWSKQYYHYVVTDWLEGDPAQPSPPPERRQGRNHEWTHLFARDVISMPDKWEFPWFASWDLGFHCVALAHVDPQFAKEQILLMLREWYMHPNGQIPAYEWDFGDVNPPVLSMAAVAVFEIERRRTGVADYAFLERVFHKMLLNFTWWVNRKDALGNNIFQGGFLGMDNIGVFDRDKLPPGYLLGQADGTSWMAAFAKSMLSIALLLAEAESRLRGRRQQVLGALHLHRQRDEQPARPRHVALGRGGRVLLRPPDLAQPASRWPCAPAPWSASSRCSVRPRCPPTLRALPGVQPAPPVVHRPPAGPGRQPSDRWSSPGPNDNLILGLVRPDQLRRMLAYMLDEDEFLSPYGVRSVSRYHQDHPLVLQLDGQEYRLDYEPGESQTEPVRRQLQLARADLDAGQLPHPDGAASSTTSTTGTTSGSNARPARAT